MLEVSPMKPINRRQFLQMMCMGAVAASTTTYFDMGRRLYLPQPQLYALGTVVAFPDDMLIYSYEKIRPQVYGWRLLSTQILDRNHNDRVRFDRLTPKFEGYFHAKCLSS